MSFDGATINMQCLDREYYYFNFVISHLSLMGLLFRFRTAFVREIFEFIDSLSLALV